MAEPFRFPPTITSGSYNLRKAYITFLWDLEQVYFNGKSGEPVPPPSERHLSAEDAEKVLAAAHSMPGSGVTSSSGSMFRHG